MGTDYTHEHAAALCVQLPRESRLVRACAPECAWSESDYMLNKIEYLLRHVIWQRTKDAEHGRGRPKPCPTPAEAAALRKKLEQTDMAGVARKLNIEGV